MIVDVHSHAWDASAHLSDDFKRQATRARGGDTPDLSIELEDYLANAPDDVMTIVFGGKARLSGIWVPDDYVARYVAQLPTRLIGFMSVDPTQSGWERELREGHQSLGLCGVKLLPMYAGFSPADPKLNWFWAYVQEHRLPVLLHTGTTFISQSHLEFTLPRHLDVVGRRYPEARIILAHLGHPYEGECVAVIRKHEHIYADISALYYRPFQLYHSLMLVQEYGVWHKLLFGTDYPFAGVDDTIAGLRGLNEMLAGTALPRLDADAINQMVYRDSLSILGLSGSGMR
jgi:predicted TIM-barrel fold metal-dependent hydrolase